MDNQRNLLLAVVLSGLLIFGWQFAVQTFYPEAGMSDEQAAQTAAGAQAPSGAAVPSAADGSLAG